MDMDVAWKDLYLQLLTTFECRQKAIKYIINILYNKL